MFHFLIIEKKLYKFVNQLNSSSNQTIFMGQSFLQEYENVCNWLEIFFESKNFEPAQSKLTKDLDIQFWITFSKKSSYAKKIL